MAELTQRAEAEILQPVVELMLQIPGMTPAEAWEHVHKRDECFSLAMQVYDRQMALEAAQQAHAVEVAAFGDKLQDEHELRDEMWKRLIVAKAWEWAERFDWC